MSRIVDQAIRAGKFSESRRKHYERLYAANPEATERLIDSLVAVRVPGEALAPESAPVSTAPYGFFDERWTTREFQDTMATKDGTRPALGSYPTPFADPSRVEPLSGFERRSSTRITFGG